MAPPPRNIPQNDDPLASLMAPPQRNPMSYGGGGFGAPPVGNSFNAPPKIPTDIKMFTPMFVPQNPNPASINPENAQPLLSDPPQQQN